VSTESHNEFSGSGENIVQAQQIESLTFFQSPDHPLPIPRQLPPNVSGFSNRFKELQTLDLIVDEQRSMEDAPPLIIVITGMPGVGKTSLSVNWANKMKDLYPDAQLYANLRGFDFGPPATASQILDQFLRALDVSPSKIPEQEEGRAALYRSIMHNRKALVFLDNARDAGQIRPLIPPSGSSLTVVTSRNKMSGLTVHDGALRFPLAPFTPEAAISLLTRNKITTNEQESRLAYSVARSCGFLPLTLRIVLDRMQFRNNETFEAAAEEIIDELGEARSVLDSFNSLDGDGLNEVKVVFSWSYGDLPNDVARLFRLLGLHPGIEFSVDDASKLADLPKQDVTMKLNILTQLSILERVGRGRYRFHDLMRSYAVERVNAEEDKAERIAAARRFLLYYLQRVDAADRILAPGRRHVLSEVDVRETFESYESALQWCELERPNFVAAVQAAEASGLHDMAWKLGMALITFFHLRKYRADRLIVCDISVRSSEKSEDVFGKAWSYMSLGGAYTELARYEEAVVCHEEAIRLWRLLGDSEGVGKCLDNWSETYFRQGNIAGAVRIGVEALEFRRELGKLREIAITLCTLGYAQVAQNDIGSAGRCFEEAAAIDSYADRQTTGDALRGLAIVSHKMGDFRESRSRFEQAIEVYRESGDSFGEAVTKRSLSEHLIDRGLVSEAKMALSEALSIMRAIDDSSVPDLQRELEALGGSAE
jgi:tetratricopeptide (TPR) repeat protein